MTTVVVPFRSGGKTRLPEEIRVEVALAMLGDVLEACVEHGCDVRLVTDDGAASLVADGLGVELVDDPGGGQGAAVAAGLRGLDGVCLVVNADLPRIRPSDLTALAYAPHAVIGLRNHGITATGESLTEILDRIQADILRQVPMT